MNLGTGMHAMLRKMEMRFAVEIAVNIEEKRDTKNGVGHLDFGFFNVFLL